MREKKQHPSYGMISASNVFGASTLFGTDIKPHGYISIRICKAVEELDLGKFGFSIEGILGERPIEYSSIMSINDHIDNLSDGEVFELLKKFKSK